MKLYKLTQETTETMQKIADRVGSRSFLHSEINDIAPSQQFLKKMENKGHVIKGDRDPSSRIRKWRITPRTLEQLTGGN